MGVRGLLHVRLSREPKHGHSLSRRTEWIRRDILVVRDRQSAAPVSEGCHQSSGWPTPKVIRSGHEFGHPSGDLADPERPRARYFHKAGGINVVAQIAKDIGDKADSGKPAMIAASYESSSVRRLGFLLELAGFEEQARALEPFAKKAKTATPLNPGTKPLVASLAKL
jgi:hypothetical protein